MAISKVVIAGVRGIRQAITLDLAGKSILIHGDNGTGKSSIERALRWALTGQEEPDASAQWDTEAGSRRHKLVAPTDPRVTVEFTDGGAITVQPGTYQSNPKGDGKRIAIKRGLPFLRRAELLDVLKSKPVDRFQYFESFLGFDEVDAFLKELTEEKAALERRRTELINKLSNNVDAIKPLLPFDRQRDATSYGALERQIVQTVAACTQLDLQTWDLAVQAIDDAYSQVDDGNLEGRRQAAERSASEFVALGERLRSAAIWSSAREQRLQALHDAAADGSVLSLLDHALAHFRAKEGAVCPVCKQPIDWAATRGQLDERRQGLREYSQLLRERSAVYRTWVRLIHTADEAVTRAYGAVGIAPPKMPVELAAVREAQDRGIDAEELAARGIGSERIAKLLGELMQAADDGIAGHLAKMPAPGREPAVRLASALVKRFAAVRPELFLLDSESAELTDELQHLATVQEALRRARQDVAADVLRAIGQTVERYYVLIHPRDLPDEATGAPSIEVQRHGRGTAFVRGRFEDDPVKDPTWVYSDGHLDTVGICVFLALRRMRGSDKGDARLLVLDDIVLSIDLGHARRLIELLRTEFADHQVLLFTHNGLFAYWCKHLLPNIERMRITSWTLEKGPAIGDLATSAERLRSVMTSSDPKEIALHIMSLMDEWCAEARYAHALAVPARFEEQYTLTDIWNPLGKKIRALSKELGTDLGGAIPMLDRIRDLPAMRNALPAHDNDFAREYPRQVVIDTAADVLALTEALRCGECRTFAVRPTNAAVVACKCGGIVFTKKRKPSGK